MSERVSMPALGESVTEGTVTRWLKGVGDQVEVDEPLLEVSTDKVDTEIPSPVAGVLQEILAQEDDTVEVGGDLAVIGDSDGAPAADSGSENSGSEEGQTESGDGSADDSADDSDAEAETSGSDTETSGSGEAEEDAPAEPEPASQGSAPGASGGSSGGGGDGAGQTVTMPALGESVTEGTVTRWLKAEGDEVEVDEPLLEVSTDKVDTEIPSPAAGVLTKILAAEDDTVEVGGELAVIGGEASDSGSGQGAAEADDSDADDDDDGDDDDGDDDLAAEQRTQDAAADEAVTKTSTSEEAASPEKPARPEEAAETEKAADAQSRDTAESSGQSSAAHGSGQSADVSAYVTPLVRKLAAQHDVDLTSLQGTGVGGRIRKQDVLEAATKAKETAAAPAEEAPAKAPQATDGAESAAPAPDPAAKRGKTEKMSRLRTVIATRMVESLQVSAQLTTVVEVDVTKVARLRDRHKRDFLGREGVKLSFMPFFALAAIEALKQHPNVNASIEDDQIQYHAQENLGVAVDTERGLLVPVIKDAGDLNIAGIARKIADLAERTRTHKIGPDELGGGTFTLTNTGSRGALFDTPILNQPQVGILGTGSVVRRPVVVVDADGGETIAIRSMVYLALTYDHRLVDGADAARFLETVKSRLEDASFEV